MSAIALGMIIFAYLCGSISSAVLICRLIGLPDPRRHGSENPGATNVLRIGGKAAALAVLICDILKGMIPVWLAYYLNIPPFYLGIIAIAACLGHIYPIFFRFKGGKGVATAFGSIVAIGWGLSSVVAGTWLLTVLLSGYSSLGAIVTALLAPFYVWWFKPEFTFPVAMLSCLTLFRHHDNIQRLWRGQESRIWQKMKKKSEKTNKKLIQATKKQEKND
ncbi:putative glycerol-3-phosphate acyltransferase [Arsenophonus endosymbiont of Aleurodicus floccissimus]|uniref:glycerol-3-phosphate 1-O-acyltransferase PlsY n=1 Tax=Arsenophonus endosymbiont of Aleurodicus floccissimus TaxID=2152761 RepID=UPI000E6B1341|nr:glycerol-3-phosphate 1-O-acyltransferase PlsY [Arsenophonus endosymbiont of Aleurodicus floccissimus]SPP32184.1 putative glycerol-3-phosphate acyltransferase [Arsenophonus endosymbiont of Aleurodicus floccissimus]